MWIKRSETEAINTANFSSIFVRDAQVRGVVIVKLEGYGDSDLIYEAPLDRPELAKQVFDRIMESLGDGKTAIWVTDFPAKEKGQ